MLTNLIVEQLILDNNRHIAILMNIINLFTPSTLKQIIII